MAYILLLTPEELADNRTELQTKLRLTRAYPKNSLGIEGASGPPLALVFSGRDQGSSVRYLEWIGVVSRTNTVGTYDDSITIDPLRPCLERIPLDGPSGLLGEFREDLREDFLKAFSVQSVGACSREAWQEFERILREKHARMVGLLDWLLGQANPQMFDAADPAGRSWQEQRDCAACLVRIAGFPPLTLAAWQPPTLRDAPYLAGLIPQPVEHSMIEHDIRNGPEAFAMSDRWWRENGTRCDIHVLTDATGRRLEIANINATPAEARTGSDMIYYHEPTHSMVLVQYKRLDWKTKSMRADQRFYDQLDRLEKVAAMNKKAVKPHEWRLGDDPCFVKFAHWPDKVTGNALNELTPGMYLPVSYVRLLLSDESTRGIRMDSQARILSYDRVERHLVGSQFVELVKHGLVGTVGVTPDELRDLVSERSAAGQSLMVGVETGDESVHEREARHRKRGAVDRSYAHEVIREQTGQN
jgi:hypothetical protein